MSITLEKGNRYISSAFKHQPEKFDEWTRSGKPMLFYDHTGELIGKLASWKSLPKVVKETAIKHSVEYPWFPTYIAGMKKDALGKPYMEVYKRPFNMCENGALPISEKPAMLNI